MHVYNEFELVDNPIRADMPVLLSSLFSVFPFSFRFFSLSMQIQRSHPLTSRSADVRKLSHTWVMLRCVGVCISYIYISA